MRDARALWVERLTGPVAAAVVLALFWVGLLASVREKSLTSDEIAHAVAGYTYWKYNDYRLNPENGNLPQRAMALPLLLSELQPPPRDHEAWRSSNEWEMGDIWFHRLGNDLAEMLFRGRAAIGVLTVGLGALVWFSSRSLFGPLGGMLSLLLFVASPTVLANGALMTSDATCALFFLAAVLSLWRVLQRVTVGRVLLSGLVAGGMFVSKMSAVLLVPIGVTLIVARLIDGRPLWIGFGWARHAANRSTQALALAAVAVAHAALVLLVIWASYGFRFAAFAPPVSPEDRFQHPWEMVLEKPDPLSHLSALDLTETQQARASEILARSDGRHPSSSVLDAVKAEVLTPTQSRKLEQLLVQPPPARATRAFEFARRHELLPEAYIYGYAHAWRFSRMRSAFFNGEYGVSGWKTFFPYTFLVKTPLPVFGAIGLALAAALARWRSATDGHSRALGREFRAGLYATLPLWVLLAFYWAAVIPSRLNIGHRHIMATYPPLFVLCGAAGYWLQALAHRPGEPFGRAGRRGGLAVCALVALLLADVAYRYPHYLAYFNGIVTPRNAYRHLVDSSLDWGQDLPGLKRYLETHRPPEPVYLSYFGTARPESYGIKANYLYSAAGLDLPRTPVRALHTTKDKLERDIADAKRAWADCELVARADREGGQVTMVFLQRPPLPRLAGGTYFISATMLPAIFFGVDGPLGQWNERFERTYRELQHQIAPLLADNAKQRADAFLRLPPDRWTEIFESFAQYRFARLTAYLRQREPDDHVGYSILVYRLTDADLETALNGPPAELGSDFAASVARNLEESSRR